jgi:hypothetical protein
MKNCAFVSRWQLDDTGNRLRLGIGASAIHAYDVTVQQCRYLGFSWINGSVALQGLQMRYRMQTVLSTP